jgi:MerR family transcriptional regulator, light-induced transcriptional regulator
MSHFTRREIAHFAPGEHGIAQFALQVVSIMMGDGSHLTRPPREDLLRLLVRGALTGDPEILNRLSSEFRRLRIPAEAAVDVYIPAAVDEIGAAWHEDIIDVLEATVAVARLQNLLRELSRSWHADDTGAGAEGSILMIVPETEQHTLGAMIATAQMRRIGVSVSVQLNPAWQALEDLMGNRRFDGVFVSVGNHESLESARIIVKTMERRLKSRLPVVVGGSIPVEPEVMQRATGADFATKDVKAALAFLGLKAGLHAAQ